MLPKLLLLISMLYNKICINIYLKIYIYLYLMSSQTLTQVLSKLKHGTIIRHKETFKNIKLLDYGPKCSLTGLTNIHVGNNTLGYLTKEEFSLLKPFTKYCILFKIKGKSGFYHCNENGLFDINIKFDTLSHFATENIKEVCPKFNNVVSCLSYLEYYCKDTKTWIILSECPIIKNENSKRGRPKKNLEDETSEEKEKRIERYKYLVKNLLESRRQKYNEINGISQDTDSSKNALQ